MPSEISSAKRAEIKSKSVIGLPNTITGKPVIVKNAIFDPVDIVATEVNRIVNETNSSLNECKNNITENGRLIEKNKTDIQTNKANIEKNKTEISNIPSVVYPIGTLYIIDSSISSESFSPALRFGGTWQLLQNVFLYASGKYSAGTTGGEETHVLTVAEMAKHQHLFYDYVTGAGTTYGISRDSMTSTGREFMSSAATGFVGANAPHNNMPPFMVVDMWKRIA